MSAEEFAKLSLNDKQIAECLKKPKLSQTLVSVISDTGIQSTDKATGALLLSLAITASKNDELNAEKRSLIAKDVVAGKLKSSLQLDGMSKLRDSTATWR